MTGGIETVIDEGLNEQNRAGQLTMISKQRIHVFFLSRIKFLMREFILVSLIPFFQRCLQ